MKENNIGIVIACNSIVGMSEELKNILWGIEEEGLPYILQHSDGGNAKINGSEASKKSQLSIGIGIDDKYISLYHEKLLLEDPLFLIRIDSNTDKLRAIGTNAARLVKGIPLIIPEN